MYFRKLDIKGFGKIRDLSLDLTKGLNIIYGNNEAGKTTIQSFIKAVLFGLRGGRTGKDGSLPPAKRFKPWNINDFSGYLEYELENGEVYRAGRNFSNNSVKILDSMFNDISQSFETTKDKSFLFAEKQLGIDETCFEKTFFIKQMETRIGEDGSRELLNRILNVSSTGFEDVSYKKALEALKQAQKNFVGTDKTSTRPIDKLRIRLKELKELQKELTQKRSALFHLEQELGDLFKEKDLLENETSILQKAIQYVELSLGIEKERSIKNELLKIQQQIEVCEKELREISEKMEASAETREQIAAFSSFSEDDISLINSQYHQIQNCISEVKRLDLEISRKTKAIRELEDWIMPLNGMAGLREGTEEKIFNLKKDIERLKGEYEKSCVNFLKEKIQETQAGNRLLKSGMLIISALTVLLYVIGFFIFPAAKTIGAAALLTDIPLVYLLLKKKKRLDELQKEKKEASAIRYSLLEEVTGKQRELEEILKSAGVQSIEEFVRVKALYDDKVKSLTSLNNELSCQETERLSNLQKLSALKNAASEKLIASGIIEMDQFDAISDSEEQSGIKEEYVKNFAAGVSKYKELEPEISYYLKRSSDINSQINILYTRAEELCKKEITSKDIVSNEIASIEEKVSLQEQGAKENLRELLELCRVQQRRNEYLHVLTNGPINQGLCKKLEDEFDTVKLKLNNIQLKIRENETLLKASAEDEKLQVTEEEIEELEEKRDELEDIDASLKIAIDVLIEAGMEFQKDFAPVLNSSMSGIVRKITGGRYQDLRADDRLALKILVPETGDIVASSLLSGGTIDQLYLALRISMAYLLLSKGESLPFIMDEVFAQYDDDRTMLALEYLKELSEKRQILFFTCKKREIEMAGEICGNSLNLITLT